MTRVIVVGAGNAAFCAAIGAREQGAEVLMLERAPFELRGGNSRFTAGGMRFAYEGNEAIRTLVGDLSEEEFARTDFGAYPRDQFYDDMGRITAHRTDPELAAKLIEESHDTLRWMADRGVRFLPMYGRQSFNTDGRVRFWGGLTLEAWGGGPGLVDSLTGIAERLGVTIRYGARAQALVMKSGRVRGVQLANEEIAADAVVLACGGFESNAAWRAQYLGPGWELAKVRGTRFNTGDGIRMALEAGAASRGNWSGCHAVAWDMHAPDYGDLDIGDNFQKHSYPLGVMLNAKGRRFVDEGADFRNYTYAKYGAEILRQPGQFAWQIFDAKAAPLLRDEYRLKPMTKVSADDLEALARKLDGVDAAEALKTLQAFNAAVDESTPFDPAVKDGRTVLGIDPPKSNWANRLDTPPFTAYGVTCGITFTFGGLHVDENAQVIGEDGLPLPGLYAAGELVGGLFYFNYPGGAGLTSGAVFGRTAGWNAAT